MSECVVPWRGVAQVTVTGHRHVLRIGFKPQWVGRPEENFTDDQILSMPPEIRELRRHGGLGQIKSIAETGRGPIVLSSPDPTMAITDDERTHGAPYHVSGPGDAEIIESQVV